MANGGIGLTFFFSVAMEDLGPSFFGILESHVCDGTFACCWIGGR